MKKVFIIILSLAFFGLILGTLRAQTWNIGSSMATDIVATLDNSGTLTINGTGAMQNWDIWSRAPWDSDKNFIRNVRIDNGITSIGNYAFYDCSNLYSINIPNLITSIGEYAFYACGYLTSLTIPNSVTAIGEYAFYDCHWLNSVILSNSVASIGNFVFHGCNGLTAITIPNSVTSIGSSAFSYCSRLTAITIPNSVISIKNSAFEYCTGLTSITIPNSVTSIGSSAFYYCTGLTSISIPNSVTSIGDYVFVNCNNLTAINVAVNNLIYSSDSGVLFNKAKTTLIRCPQGISGAYSIPTSVTTIGSSAFYGCSGLTSVTIPASVTTIGIETFTGCSGLTSVTIPASVTTIGYYAFIYCIGLIFIDVAPDNPAFCSENGVLFNKNKTTLIQYPIGNSGTYVIPDSVISIGTRAFSKSIGLTSVIIPNSVTSIGNFAFSGCSGLTSVTIPNLVTSIGSFAFAECRNLTSITSLAITPPTIDQYTFSNISSQAKVYVPCTSQPTYQSTLYWKNLSYGNCKMLAINNLPQSAISVYPNPAHDQLTIESDGYIIYGIQIADMAGKTVYSSSSIISNTINVSNLSAGVYSIKVETDKGEATKKIIKY